MRGGSEGPTWGMVLTMAGPRVRASIRLTAEARQGWDHCSLNTGLPLTALIEAMGQLFHEGSLKCPPEVLERARRLELEGRSRRQR